MLKPVRNFIDLTFLQRRCAYLGAKLIFIIKICNEYHFKNVFINHKMLSFFILFKVQFLKGERFILATGYIVVNVYTSRAQLPLRNAQVSVTDGNEAGPKLLGFRLTGATGKTDQIEIETPALDLSLSPSKETAFAVCNVKISHPSYYTLNISDVQVFANTQTLQNVELIPLTENSKPQDRTINRTTPSQNL